MNRIYACIDLKSFYASVECRERNLDPITTNLVVADGSRTDKTVCLAIGPAMKQYGLGGRARLYEVRGKVREVNRERFKNNNYKKFIGRSINDKELKENKDLELDFIIAPPRMAYYMKYSTSIYNVYLKYISKDDIYVYSIDEVFMDLTDYLNYYKMTPRELVTKMIHDVYKTTGITATAGIGTNMFLAKVAMDIDAKHTEPDEYGVRLSELDEMSYRKRLWEHRPLTSFWRIGKGIARKLEENHMYTMGDICRCSIENEDKLFKLFGVNAELIIDHAWGYEPCTIKDVKAIEPVRKSLGSGQVLHCPYDYYKTKLIIKEMSDLLALDLVSKNLVTNQLVLTVGYDIENLTNPEIRYKYHGEITSDHYGRSVPKPAHGTFNIDHYTSSSNVIINSMVELYDRIINKDLLIRRINMAANVFEEGTVCDKPKIEQINLFDDYQDKTELLEKQKEEEKEEKILQNVLLDIKNKYGKNAILRGMNYEEGATTKERNGQIGGHKG